MTENPHLLHEAPHSWRLSPQTRELGRQGVARARAALRDAARRQEAAQLTVQAPGDARQHAAADGHVHEPRHRTAA